MKYRRSKKNNTEVRNTIYMRRQTCRKFRVELNARNADTNKLITFTIAVRAMGTPCAGAVATRNTRRRSLTKTVTIADRSTRSAEALGHCGTGASGRAFVAANSSIRGKRFLMRSEER